MHQEHTDYSLPCMHGVCAGLAELCVGPVKDWASIAVAGWLNRVWSGLEHLCNVDQLNQVSGRAEIAIAPLLTIFCPARWHWVQHHLSGSEFKAQLKGSSLMIPLPCRMAWSSASFVS